MMLTTCFLPYSFFITVIITSLSIKTLLCLQVKVDCQLEPETSSIEIVSRAKTTGKTGVEMEALTACTVAALTVYDMCKAASKSTQITNVMLLQKSGGKSGDYNHRKEKTIL